MVTEAATIDERLEQISKALTKFHMIVEDKDMEIAQLKDKLETSNAEEPIPNHGSSSRLIEKVRQVGEKTFKHI